MFILRKNEEALGIRRVFDELENSRSTIELSAPIFTKFSVFAVKFRETYILKLKLLKHQNANCSLYVQEYDICIVYCIYLYIHIYP